MIKIIAYFLFFAYINANQLKVPSAYSTIQAGLNAASSGDTVLVAAGSHSIKWNATNDLGGPVGAGVYLYKFQAKDFVKTRKMVLLK